MAVLIEAVSVVIRIETIADKYPGGLEQYIKDFPNRTLCMDEDIVRVGFMDSNDAGEFIDSLVSLGFRFVTDEQFDEIAVVIQFEGLGLPCDWLDYINVVIFKGDIRVSMCKLKGKPLGKLAFPCGWDYETSLSKHTLSMSSDDSDSRMIFLRHENGVDYYLDALTGKEHWLERAAKRSLNS